MRAVKSTNTRPELIVRRIVQGLGRRPRLYDATLPGTPDFSFHSLRKVVLVHGCFWHGHSCPRGSRVPKANRDYWLSKIARNRERDRAAESALRKLGWDVLVIWECTTHDEHTLTEELRSFLW
jgi:DNA mismatch endonuclease (patch repair protein)